VEEITAHLVFATKGGIVPAVRAVMDYLAQHFKFDVIKAAGATKSIEPVPGI
jgi:hypothetical protein